jgi:amidase
MGHDFPLELLSGRRGVARSGAAGDAPAGNGIRRATDAPPGRGGKAVLLTRRDAVVMLGSGVVAGAMTSARAASGSAGDIDDLFAERDALGLAELVRHREVTPAELLDAALRRVERIDAGTHAVVLRHDEQARAQVSAGVGGPFAGVPFLLKDLHIRLAGTVTDNGSRFFRGALAGEDDELTRRYKRAGLVIFGKTGSPELGLTGTTESALHGATRNPWNLERTAGGSSGGAAAAVAARLVPVAHASDGAGSIRTPASCCGVFGLKPTRGRVPLGPERFEGWNGLTTQHAVSLSVRDNAALLDATAGPEVGSPYVAPPPVRPFLEEVTASPGSLRVALVTSPVSGSPVDAECVAAVEDTARLLEELGHHVEEAKLPVDHERTNAAMLATLCVNTLKALEDRSKVLGRPWTPEDVEPVTFKLAEMGRDFDGVAYIRARESFEEAGRAMALFHQRFDVVLTPTLAKPPVPIGVLSLSPVDFDAYVREVTTFGPFTALYNMTGQPAMSVPLFWSADGLPIGTMLAAAYGNEALLFRLAGQLERARPWWNRRPPAAI